MEKPTRIRAAFHNQVLNDIAHPHNGYESQRALTADVNRRVKDLHSGGRPAPHPSAHHGRPDHHATQAVASAGHRKAGTLAAQCRGRSARSKRRFGSPARGMEKLLGNRASMTSNMSHEEAECAANRQRRSADRGPRITRQAGLHETLAWKEIEALSVLRPPASKHLSISKPTTNADVAGRSPAPGRSDNVGGNGSPRFSVCPRLRTPLARHQ